MPPGIRHLPLVGVDNPAYQESKNAFNADHIIDPGSIPSSAISNIPTTVLMRGTFAAMPAPASTPVALYFAYDYLGGTTFRNTGTTWEQTGSGAAQGIDAFNPKAYGGKGDWQTKPSGAITAGQAILTDASNPFTAADVLKQLVAIGGGALIGQPVPGVLTTGAVGGALLGNTTYYYRVAAGTEAGITIPCAEVSKITAAGTNTNTITIPFPHVPGATVYYLYGRSTGAEQLIMTQQAATWGSSPSFTDFGTVAPAGAMPVANTAALPLVTSIASYQGPNQVTLAANATTTVVAKPYYWWTSDHTALQNMLNTNITGGGLDFMPRGTWPHRALTGFTGTRLLGAGKYASIMWLEPNQPGQTRQITFTSQSHITSEHLGWDGNRKQTYRDSIAFEHNHAMFFNNCTDVQIQYNWFYEQSGDQLYSYGVHTASSSHDVVWSFNRHENWGRTGCGSASTTEFHSLFNYFAGYGSNSYNAIHFELDFDGVDETVQNDIVMGNTMIGSGGITFGLTGSVQNVLISRYELTGNIIDQQGGVGQAIIANGGERILISSNFFRNIALSVAVFLNGAGGYEVFNNQFDTCGGGALYMQMLGSIANPRWSDVGSNRFNHCAYQVGGGNSTAIQLYECSDTILHNNRIYDTGNTNNHIGIVLASHSNRNILHDNELVQLVNAGYPITEDATCDGNSIHDNKGINFAFPFGPGSFLGTNGHHWGNGDPTTSTEWASTGDINATGGYRQTIDGWYQENVAISQVNVPLTRLATTTEVPTRWIAGRPGSVTAVWVKSNTPRTAGTCTIKVFKNGAQLGALTAVLDGANTTFKTTTQAKDVSTYVAGDELELVVATDAAWLPVTADIRASLEVES